MPFVASYTLIGGTVEVDKTYTAIQQAKAMLFLDTAEGKYVNRLGADLGVPRTLLAGDDLYRKIVQVCGLPKGILLTIQRLLEVTMGTQAELAALSLRPWALYEVKNLEFVIELPLEILATSHANAGYLHGFSGQLLDTSTATVLVTYGDASQTAALFDGNTQVAVLHNGTWSTQTITSIAYDATTDQSTITLSATIGFTPTSGDIVIVDIPGDTTHSYRGDYLASSTSFFAFHTAVGPSTTTLLVEGDCTQLFGEDDLIQVAYTGTPPTEVQIDTLSYSATTGLTTVVLLSSVSGGIVGGSFFREIEDALPPNLPIADRLYLQRFGLYEIADFYLQLIVKAAGISVRLELV